MMIGTITQCYNFTILGTPWDPSTQSIQQPSSALTQVHQDGMLLRCQLLQEIFVGDVGRLLLIWEPVSDAVLHGQELPNFSPAAFRDT